MNTFLIVLSTLTVSCIAQRSPYVGRIPVGYPQLDLATITTSTGLGSRFGEDTDFTTTERLPLEANGDRELVNMLKKRPLDRQPFWLINWIALEEQRKTFQPKPDTSINFIRPPRDNSPKNRNDNSVAFI